ncbi:MAG: hypothetical protein J5J04_17285 [Anaerolineae bacterium]|nr:hypothetical protein [Anaerolineae bacterium]
MTASIFISALGPSISEQCEKKGLVATGIKMETVDRISHAITLAHIHGVLTDAETHRARRRLLSKAKLKSAQPTERAA